MSFRSRPVLDRKHRPRWQDELRTQQLTVVGFALAIAVALGIFGAAAWNGYWEQHLRPVASVNGVAFNRADLSVRERILTAELIAQASELQAQLSGGPRDQIIESQVQSLSNAFSSLSANAATQMVTDNVLAARAADLGITVSDEQIDAEIADRKGQPEMVQASLILIDPLPDDADADDEPTDEQIADATAKAQEARDRVEGGEDFGAVAKDASDDFSSAYEGNLGWFGPDDTLYGEYFEPLADAAAGDLVGPVRVEDGIAVLKLVERREANEDGWLGDELRNQGIEDATYRAYVATNMLTNVYRTHFNETIVVSPAEQQRVAQIYIAPVSGTVVPQERARHVLIQPDPDLDDQSEATDEQWAAALEEAREVAADLAKPDADWNAIAKEHSDDSGSATRGGDVGWFDPESSPFVEPFTVALASLKVGEISEPVRTDFGWHIIQKTAERESPQAEAADIVERLKADPDAFGQIAREQSEDSTTAAKDGELGWVARWQLSRMREEAVFGLTDVGQISDPVDEATGGITIYRLLESSASRDIESDRLESIQSNGFNRWLDEVVRPPVDTWLDPQFAVSTTA